MANTGNDSVSIIDHVKGKVVSNIKTTVNPFGIGIDTIKNRAYITTDTGIDIIDYISNLNERSVNATYYDHINVGYAPFGIVVDPDTIEQYITNFQSDTISVIDTDTNTNRHKEIKVGLFPNSIAFNPVTKRLDVSSTGNNTVTVINSTSDTVLNNTETDSAPYDVAVNPKTNIVYVANQELKPFLL